MTRPGIVVESADWERVQLHLRGHITAETVREAGPGATFYLQEARSEQRVPIEYVEISGDRFHLRENVVRGLKGYPLKTGSWRLLYGLPDSGTGEPAVAADGFRLDPCGSGGLFTGGGVRFWVVPVCAPRTRNVSLAVSYRAKRASGPERRASLRSRARRCAKRTRERAFVGLCAVARQFVRPTGRRILFTSDSRAGLSGNLAYVYDRMIERGLDAEYRLSTSFKPSIAGARRALRDKFRFAWLLGTADVVLMDDYQPMVYKVGFPDHVKIVQLWHASGAFKTVGFSRVGKPGGPKPYARSHRIYTHAIVSCAHDVPLYAEAFGIAESRVIPTGIPRMDTFFDEQELDRARERALQAVPAARDREIILFAPTFRGKGPSDAYYDFELIELEALHRLCEERDALVLFKMHPFVSERMSIPEAYADRMLDMTDHREINDLLTISDLVVTDYSSLVFEYATLGRPMLFYAYDLQDYTASRDFYVDMEQFVPGRIVTSFDELLDAIRTGDLEQHKVGEFVARHFDHRDAGATDRVIDLIVGE